MVPIPVVGIFHHTECQVTLVKKTDAKAAERDSVSLLNSKAPVISINDSLKMIILNFFSLRMSTLNFTRSVMGEGWIMKRGSKFSVFLLNEWEFPKRQSLIFSINQIWEIWFNDQLSRFKKFLFRSSVEGRILEIFI